MLKDQAMDRRYMGSLARCLAFVLALAGCAPTPPAPPPETKAPVVAVAPPAAAVQSSAGSFADNPIVYFVITDRFYNGNPANDNSYGRQKDGAQEIGTFHGGDLAGISAKLKEGYFRELGVNALWITAPYEQIHGWVVGGNKEFKHYAYHGYYALDYTMLDKNMGSAEELREMIDLAHSQGIRVLFDIVMNHPGYGDIQTLSEYIGPKSSKKTGVLWSGYEKAEPKDYHSYIDYNDPAWLNWWGPGWIRSGLRGYDEGGRDDYTMQLAYLPDFKTDSAKPVAAPPFFANKRDSGVKTIAGYTVRQYLVKWLTDWVREYGVDGFRCDTAKHVEPASWKALKEAGNEALSQWKANNPSKKIDDAAFWMTGEVFPHGVERDAYFDSGFDSLINFDFQERIGNLAKIDAVYNEYAAKISKDPSFNVLSYISSHDTKLYDRAKLKDAGTALLLAPGGVQIFYGDETGRPYGPVPKTDPAQGTRSDMNWSSINQDVLKHWQKLTQFRNHHVALAKGEHAKLADAPYTFSRVHPEDRVVVAIGVSGAAKISVGQVFAEGQKVRDAYSGADAVVAGGKVSLRADAGGVVLLEAAN
jgi:alpha-amylase